MSVWVWKHSQGMSRSLLVALSYQRHMSRCFYEWIVIILFIKDFILNLSRSQLFLQSSLIEEHPIQQAFIVLMFPSLLFGQQKAAIKSLNGWLALLCSRSLCLGCDVMHTWWANKQKLLDHRYSSYSNFSKFKVNFTPNRINRWSSKSPLPMDLKLFSTSRTLGLNEI